MGTNDISIHIFNTPDEAPNYNSNGAGFKGAELKKVLIVRNGTVQGAPTVDLQFVDQDGNQYIAMVTANLLKMVLVAAGVVSP